MTFVAFGILHLAHNNRTDRHRVQCSSPRGATESTASQPLPTQFSTLRRYSSRVSQNTIAIPSTKTLRAVGRPALRNGAPRATADRNIDGGHEPYANWLIEVAASPVLSKEDAFSTPNRGGADSAHHGVTVSLLTSGGRVRCRSSQRAGVSLRQASPNARRGGRG